jgi:hypothetical protein
MVKQIVCILVLLSFVVVIPGYGKTITEKHTFYVRKDKGSLVDLVKFTKNVKGIYNIQIPECMESLGFEVTEQSWKLEDSLVILKIAAQRSVSADTAILSYAWLPEYVWKVDRATKKVSAVNSLAKNWMAKGTL